MAAIDAILLARGNSAIHYIIIQTCVIFFLCLQCTNNKKYILIPLLISTTLWRSAGVLISYKLTMIQCWYFLSLILYKPDSNLSQVLEYYNNYNVL